MTKIINILNNGNKDGAKTGEVIVGSYNVAPTTINAAPTPATISVSDLNKYDFWKVQRTSADTDEFDLPDGAALGQVITLYCVTGFELRTATDSNKINDVASKGFTTVTGDLIKCTKVTAGSAGSWIVEKLDKLGAVVTVVAGVA